MNTETPIFDQLYIETVISDLFGDLRENVGGRRVNGEHLRDAGHAQTTEAADPRIILAIDAAIDRLNKAGRPWSANDLRESLPVTHGPLVGARVRAAATRRPREMVRIGYVPSTLASTHAHPIAQWIGAGAIEMAS